MIVQKSIFSRILGPMKLRTSLKCFLRPKEAFLRLFSKCQKWSLYVLTIFGTFFKVNFFENLIRPMELRTSLKCFLRGIQ